MKYILRAIRSLYLEVLTPSAGVGYNWAVIASGHVILGALLSIFALILYIPFKILIPIWYWIGKETGDVRRGGSVADGVKDTILVGLGSLYAGPSWWPIMVFTVMVIGAIFTQARKEFKDDQQPHL